VTAPTAIGRAFGIVLAVLLTPALAGVLTRLSPDRHRHAYRTVGYGGAGWHLLRCDCGAEEIG